MTYFWVQMVHLGITGMHERDSHTLKPANANDEQDTDPRVLEDFAHFLTVNAYLVDGQLWADYYSKELLMSAEAKQGVWFPDIKKLPDVLYPVKTAKLDLEKKDSDSVSISSKTL